MIARDSHPFLSLHREMNRLFDVFHDKFSGSMSVGSQHGPMMPGMLTPEQMSQLDAARGPEFDRLFLTFMIQHHQGAITMVQQLLAVPGAAQDGPIFRFASDVNVDQTTEINRMTLMLNDLKRSSQ